IILQHPAVADVSVVSASHQVKGEAPVAWVVLHKGEDTDEMELKQFFFSNGPAYAHPRRVFFLDEIPVSGTNKIDRKWLTEEAARRIPEGITGGMG
ncbi:MAG: class I adenylate-forming enzyme family protein, partial [Dehalococcoidia bacterium]|nr:class I adenylate-forming enzyme family protein [Chloroflexota bacterium]MCY4651578.1 class I adenylate-forming enzyme family protein [Dehalococcoidia bacterium]